MAAAATRHSGTAWERDHYCVSAPVKVWYHIVAFNCPLSPIKYRVHDGKINGGIVEHWPEPLVAFFSHRPPLIEFYSRRVSVGSPFNRCVTTINHRVAEERPAGFKWHGQGDGFKRAFLSARHSMASVSIKIKDCRQKRRFIWYQFIGLPSQSHWD